MKKSVLPIILILLATGGAVAIARAKSNDKIKSVSEKYFLSGRFYWPEGEKKPPLMEIFSKKNGYTNLNQYTDSSMTHSADVSVTFEPAVIGADMGEVSKLVGQNIEVMGYKWKIKEAYEL